MTSIVTSIVNFVDRRSGLCLIMSIGLILLALPGLTYYQAQNDVRIWFKSDDPNILALDQFEHRFGNDESLAIALHHPEGLFTPERIEALRELTDQVWQIPQVIRVDSLITATVTESSEDEILIDYLLVPDVPWDADYLAKREQVALEHPRLPGYLISQDGKTALIFARLSPTLEGSPNYEWIVATAREFIAPYQDRDGLKLYLTGEATINNAFREIAADDSKVILPLLFLVITISLGLLFHSFLGVLLPLGLTIFTVTTTLGLGFFAGLKFNSILNILPAILVAVTIADSVHILMSYFQFRAMGEEPREATLHSLNKNIVPTLLTSLTTMIGFLSLTFTDLLPIKRLGLMAGLGCVLAWYFSIFLLGPLLLRLELKLPNYLKNLYGGLDKEGNRKAKISRDFIAWIARFRPAILGFFALLSGASLWLGLQNEINANPYTYFAPETAIRQANTFIKENFGGTSGPEVMISTGETDGIKDPAFLKKVEAFKTWLEGQEFVDKTIDIVDIVKEMNQSFHGGERAHFKIPDDKNQVAQLLFLYTLSLPQGMDLNNRMSLNYESMRMSILWRIQTSKDWGYWIQEIEKKAVELGLNIQVTGKTNLFQRMMGYVVLTFSQSIIAASILVCLLMMILFRSVKIGLISLLPNIMPLILGAAFMKLSGMSLNIGTTLVASVCLGIAVDDTIHFLSNYYRWRAEGMSRADALTQIMTFTGSALIVTTVILVAAFGLFMLGSFTPNVNFGVMCAFVLLTALIVDLVFLPALLLKKEPNQVQ